MVNKKKVNIQSQYPLYVFTPPLTGVINGAELTYPEIYNCLGQGAVIKEILEDGSELRLTYKNYNMVNVPEPKIVPLKNNDEVLPVDPVDENEAGELTDEVPPVDENEAGGLADEVLPVDPVDGVETDGLDDEVLPVDPVDGVETDSIPVEVKPSKESNKPKNKGNKRK